MKSCDLWIAKNISFSKQGQCWSCGTHIPAHFRQIFQKKEGWWWQRQVKEMITQDVPCILLQEWYAQVDPVNAEV